jgi:hypothetical protein
MLVEQAHLEQDPQISEANRLLDEIIGIERSNQIAILAVARQAGKYIKLTDERNNVFIRALES